MYRLLLACFFLSRGQLQYATVEPRDIIRTYDASTTRRSRSPPVSSSDFQWRTVETNNIRVTLQPALSFTPASSFSTPECPLPPASAPVIRTAKRRHRLGEQPIALQKWTTEATSAAEVASVRRQTSSRKMIIEAQLAESRRVSETFASQDSNAKPAEVEAGEGDENEGNPMDIEADFEETTAMAMKDRVVSINNTCLHGLTLRTYNNTGSLPPSQGSYSRRQDRVYKGRAHV